MVRRLISENIDLSCNLAADLWPVKADADQIVQVILNLCVNSRDAMPNGGSLVISTRNHPAPAAGGPAVGPHPSTGRAGPRRNLRLRHRHRNPPRNPGEALRAVLHHQGARRRDRPRPGHRLRNRPAIRRTHPRRERARPWIDLLRSPAALPGRPHPHRRICPALQPSLQRTGPGSGGRRRGCPARSHRRASSAIMATRLAAADGIEALDNRPATPISPFWSAISSCRAWEDANWPAWPPKHLPTSASSTCPATPTSRSDGLPPNSCRNHFQEALQHAIGPADSRS